MKINLNDSFQIAAIMTEMKKGATISIDLEVVHTWKSNFFGTLGSKIVSFFTGRTATTGKMDDVVGKILLAERSSSTLNGLSNAIKLISVLRNSESDTKQKSELGKLVSDLKKTEKNVQSVQKNLNFLSNIRVSTDNAGHVSKLFQGSMKLINKRMNRECSRFFSSSDIHRVVSKKNKVNKFIEKKEKDALMKTGLEIAHALSRAPTIKDLNTGVKTVERIARKIGDKNVTTILKGVVNSTENRTHREKLQKEDALQTLSKLQQKLKKEQKAAKQEAAKQEIEKRHQNGEGVAFQVDVNGDIENQMLDKKNEIQYGTLIGGALNLGRRLINAVNTQTPN